MICLVTQLSMDRLPAFEMQLKNWEGPISAAVYVDHVHNSQEATEDVAKLLKFFDSIREHRQDKPRYVIAKFDI